MIQGFQLGDEAPVFCIPCTRADGPTFEPCDALRVLLRDRIRHVDRTIEDLARSRTLLARFVADMDGLAA